MTEIVRKATISNAAFWVCLIFSIALITGGFLTPPLAKIDGSLITAVGELFAFATLWVVWHSIKMGVDARLTHGKTSVTIGDLNKPTPPSHETEND